MHDTNKLFINTLRRYDIFLVDLYGEIPKLL